ncbi:MAG: type IV pilus twitching motility protein PilT [Fimbriimonadaceae bacterium]
MRSVKEYLRICVEMSGSDLHFKCDTGKIYVRVFGDLQELDEPHYKAKEFEEALFSMFTPQQVERYHKDLDLDFALEIEGLARFRGNAYQQRSHTQAAFRVIPFDIQPMEELMLPPAAYDFITKPRGLVLVTGPAGSGKSTSLAAMIDRINRTQGVHIVTVEDPIEFVHEDKMALVHQRELYEDTNSFYNALKYVLRQDPDVILVGEMRDLETIHQAITSAETGHLVFATLHTVDAVQTVDRIIDVFPIHQQQQIRMQLSVNLVGVISQTLVKRKDGTGRIAAFETLLATNAVRNLIRENRSYQIGSLIQTGARSKMQTLDQSLVKLIESGLVEYEEAKSKAKEPFEFDRLVALVSEGKDGKQRAPQPADPGPQVAADGTAQTSGGVRGQPNRPGYRKE